MALADEDRIAGFALPIRGKRFVVLLIELPRRIIGDIQQLDGGGRQREGGADSERQEGAGQNRARTPQGMSRTGICRCSRIRSTSSWVSSFSVSRTSLRGRCGASSSMNSYM